MPKSFCFEEDNLAEDAAPLLCPAKKEQSCCPQFNKKCCPVKISIDKDASLSGEGVVVVIENKSDAPLLPFLRFSLGPVDKEDDCSIAAKDSGKAKIIGYVKRFNLDGTADGYDVLVRLSKGLPACDGKVAVTVVCATPFPSGTELQACIECFCPDLEAALKCKAMVVKCRARGRSSPRGIKCCVPICGKPFIVPQNF